VKMNELDPEYRSHSRKEEVNLGLNEEQALTEAKRCLDCANPSCMEGCPVGINIPGFIKNIERGEFLEAARVLKQTSALPAVCHVCPNIIPPTDIPPSPCRGSYPYSVHNIRSVSG